MSNNTFQVVITARDEQRVAAALTAYSRRDWRAVADVMKAATDDKRGFQFHVATLRALALLTGIDSPGGETGPRADHAVADLQALALRLAAEEDR